MFSFFLTHVISVCFYFQRTQTKQNYSIFGTLYLNLLENYIILLTVCQQMLYTCDEYISINKSVEMLKQLKIIENLEVRQNLYLITPWIWILSQPQEYWYCFDFVHSFHCKIYPKKEILTPNALSKKLEKCLVTN